MATAAVSEYARLTAGMTPIRKLSDLEAFAGKIVAYITEYDQFGCSYDPEGREVGYTTGYDVFYAFIAPEKRPTAVEVIDTTKLPVESVVTSHLMPPSRVFVLHKLLSPHYRGGEIPGFLTLTDEVLKAHFLAMRALSFEEREALRSQVLPFEKDGTPYFGGRKECEYTQTEMFEPYNTKIVQTTIRMHYPTS